MATRNFIVVGENIHCTRIYKVGGSFAQTLPNGEGAIVYGPKGQTRRLPVPPVILHGADWAAGKVKHCGVAVWHALSGAATGRAAAADYIAYLARRQTDADAAFLDINVDEFSTDIEERVRAMQWMCETIQKNSALPLSIDSSNPAILRAGLAACDPKRGKPMVNSVSLERQASIAVAAEFHAVVIASAAGEKDLPCNTHERLANLARLMPLLDAAGLRGGSVYVDPLVFPVATDSNNGVAFLDAVRAVRAAYGPEIHICAGLSNISFGMPNRKLINQVFTWLAVEAGADGGIVDPLQINQKILDATDTAGEPFRLARALLTGEDLFGAEFIAAHREGKLGGGE